MGTSSGGGFFTAWMAAWHLPQRRVPQGMGVSQLMQKVTRSISPVVSLPAMLTLSSLRAPRLERERSPTAAGPRG